MQIFKLRHQKEKMDNNYKRSKEAETKSNNKNVGEIYRDISEFKNVCEL
jgi:hypothetical protein